LSDCTIDISGIYITFLSFSPGNIDIEVIHQRKTQSEDFKLIGRAVYLYCPMGYGKTKLTNTFFESMLKVSATTRNYKTTIELLNIAEKLA
jgi:uncharacterized protein (DUF1697 family)